MPKTRFIAALVALWLSGTAAAAPDRALMAEILQSPSVTCVQTFRCDVPPEIWNRALDHIDIMGGLWSRYGFQPSYRTTPTGAGGLHIVDPSGIVGDLHPIARSDRSRTYYGEGTFDHWAIPAVFSAAGVAVVDYRADGRGVSGVMKLHLRGSNRISRFAMGLVSGLLVRHIGRRFRNNLEDTGKILRDIARDPDKVRQGLDATMRKAFDRAFPPPGSAEPPR